MLQESVKGGWEGIVRNRLEAGGKVRGGRIKGLELHISRRQSVHFSDWALCLITMVYPVIKSSPIFLCNSTLCPTCGCCKVLPQVTGDKPAGQQLETRVRKSKCQQVEWDYGSLNPRTCSASDCSAWESTCQRPEWGPQAIGTARLRCQQLRDQSAREVRVSATRKATMDDQACKSASALEGPVCTPMNDRSQGHWLEGLVTSQNSESRRGDRGPGWACTAGLQQQGRTNAPALEANRASKGFLKCLSK